jgi:hypothetical protein
VVGFEYPQDYHES